MSDVYVVRLTGQTYACLQAFAKRKETIQPLRAALSVAIQAARPEPAERRAVLEQLAALPGGQMTNVEIEAAREQIRAVIPPIGDRDTYAARRACDALCAAARENSVMRELCEAIERYWKAAESYHADSLNAGEFQESKAACNQAFDVYREMKEEQGAD